MMSHGLSTARATLVLLAVCSSAPSTAQRCTFPSSPGTAACASADGRYVIKETLATRGADDAEHVLALENRELGTTVEVYRFGRSLSVVWSLDSKHFTINDYAGSDYTRNYLFAAAGARVVVDMNELLSEKVLLSARRDHVYISAWRWARRDRVEVLLYGHGGQASFCRCFEVSTSASIMNCPTFTIPSRTEPEDYCWKLIDGR